MDSNKPILVTGSHASGTTWIGSMISFAPKVAYLHEPFNIELDRTICKAKFKDWFTYVCEENETEFVKPIQDMLDFHANIFDGIKESNTLKILAKQILTLARFSEYRLFNFRPLIKDPIAVLSVEWLARKFDVVPVILIRHPAAFTGSLKNNNWANHPFDDFISQPLLMRDYLAPFSDEIQLFSQKKQSVVDQAALLWNIIHHVISIYRDKHPEWLFMRHEDISRDPINQFRIIFEKLDIPFTSSIEENIKYYSENEKKKAVLKNRFSRLQRNSAKNIKSWKTRLTQDEVDRVREKVGEISSLFYSDEEWE
ncbi:MAG: sulfotransferase domain-containing protein [Chloroflexi bacterium]|nr:sulfotransferase domain-containing protein [Chloroflexota bacterium]